MRPFKSYRLILIRVPIMQTLSTMFLSFALVANVAMTATAAEQDASKSTAVAGSAAKTQAAPQSDGEVKKVDKDAGKITIKHGPLVNLDMPAMTMVFRVNEPAMLNQVKAGDKVKFTAEKVNGAITITALQTAK